MDLQDQGRPLGLRMRAISVSHVPPEGKRLVPRKHDPLERLGKQRRRVLPETGFSGARSGMTVSYEVAPENP